MPSRIMEGPVALTMLWIWLGFVAICLLGYWLSSKRSHKSKTQPQEKYAKRLLLRMQKNSSIPGKSGDSAHKRQ